MTTTKTRTTPNLLERFPLHPLLWGIYPLLALWLANLSQIPPFAVVRSALLTLALTGIVWLMNLLLFRNWIKAGLGSSLFLLVFFTYGHLYNLVKMVPLLAPWLGRHRVLLAVVLAVLIGLYFLLWRTRKPLYALNQIASVIGLFLVLFVSLQILIFQLGRASSLQAQAQTRPEKPASNQEGGRDVYYILLDTYGRQDYLASIGIDNSEFVRQLEARGFVVDSCAQANYDLTAFSLAASLNMDYLDALQVPMHPELADEKSEELEGLLKYSRVRREFEQMGYQTVTFKAVYPWIDITDSDVYFDPEQDTSILQRQESLNFQYLYLSTTALRLLTDYMADNPLEKINRLPAWMLNFARPEGTLLNTREYRSYVLNQYSLDRLENVPDLPGKKFVYAHLFSTHIPFVYRRNGEFWYSPVDTNEGYGNAILYTNDRILKIIDLILKKSSIPPIIILQGDHNNAVTADRVKILDAYYLPDGGAAKAYPGMTPVNTFRLVLDYYFGQNLGFLPDRSYHSPYRQPYQFQEVTTPCTRP
ncbi:MAG TPA: hypothetical protein DEQ80_01175 [Anaerolinea thermolimosa]|uniref:Sulfatase N-terminal domain-containing protein n=1 Tax=Anaerolinea thermolimosa TaxID=229919 RepID=A0A3D1JDW6_9CHLR|nr:hypothetical protein [Anaerolinea thermolimosa]